MKREAAPGGQVAEDLSKCPSPAASEPPGALGGRESIGFFE